MTDNYRLANLDDITCGLETIYFINDDVLEGSPQYYLEPKSGPLDQPRYLRRVQNNEPIGFYTFSERKSYKPKVSTPLISLDAATNWIAAVKVPIVIDYQGDDDAECI